MNMPTLHRRGRGVGGTLLFVGALAVALTLLASPAQARSFVNQGLNLPSSVTELGLGAGIGHLDAIDYTGFGLNLELGHGLRSDIELRLRTGLRFGIAGRTVRADTYGRPVNTETYNTGFETLANPEVGLRFNLTRGGTAEVAADGRVYLPLDGDFGVLVGLPVALHLRRVRLDTGIFIPIIFADPEAVTTISIPLHLWIKLDEGTFLGPMLGVRFHDGGGKSVPFGVGAGTSLAYDADLRFWLLFPDISKDDGAEDFGVGAGLYVTF
jgi:hypothetical protein